MAGYITHHRITYRGGATTYHVSLFNTKAEAIKYLLSIYRLYSSNVNCDYPFDQNNFGKIIGTTGIFYYNDYDEKPTCSLQFMLFEKDKAFELSENRDSCY